MPAIAPVAPEQATAELKPVYQSLTQNLGRVPNFLAMLAHKPEVLKNFLPLYQAITGPGALEQRYKELAYLKTAMTNGCEYCSRAHIASSKNAGVTDAQVAALTFYRKSSQFDEKDKVVLHFADQVTRAAATVREDHLQPLRAFFTEEQIVELVMVIAVANFTNRINDALQVIPDLGV